MLIRRLHLTVPVRSVETSRSLGNVLPTEFTQLMCAQNFEQIYGTSPKRQYASTPHPRENTAKLKTTIRILPNSAVAPTPCPSIRPDHLLPASLSSFPVFDLKTHLASQNFGIITNGCARTTPLSFTNSLRSSVAICRTAKACRSQSPS